MAPYSLTITAIDETAGQPVAGLKPAVPAQTFDGAPGGPGNLWKSSGREYVTVQTFHIVVVAGVKGHVLHYIAALHNANNNVVSFIQSDRFMLV
jgi:hypothetical protein